ncbi:1-phosphatidylinositol 3-phosphate 5-kinase fab1 [Choanephora cucurbitarum]|uniref:1-phosphatidylinositol-3-phosphate 5-kinase n=1 Tax=Choanephora cucurbitarum TaxID=101091 RepID=A0A1C7NMR5_9FUNG|nr:1-phosphatidylinositol 3-phosphate 5-kinase fab1 [Choanephora cucurbitarum]
MDKERRSSLTTFNFQLPEEHNNDEGVLSKIFDKVLHAVSGPAAQDNTDRRTSSESDLKRDLSLASIPSIIQSQALTTPASTSSSLNKHLASTSSSSSVSVSKEQFNASGIPTAAVIPPSPASTTATTTATVTVGNQKLDALPLNETHTNSSVQFNVSDTKRPQEQEAIDYLLSSPLAKRRSIDSDTQSVITNFSISNSNSLSRILARLRGQKSDKEFWMPDEQCKECYKCRKPFTLLRRKHHCRICGQIFCSKCASHIISGKLYKQKGQVRVCNFCYAEQLQQLNDRSSTASLNTNQADYASSKIDTISKTASVSNLSHVLYNRGDEESIQSIQQPHKEHYSSAIIPSQKPPLEVPQMQIPTTALRQAKSIYGNDDATTTTFALELPTIASDTYVGTSPQTNHDLFGLNERSHSSGTPQGDLNIESPIMGHSNIVSANTATASNTDGMSNAGGFKRLFDAGTSLLKSTSRPRSNTSSSAPLEDTARQLHMSWAYPTSPYISDRGGGTVLAESELSPFPGNGNPAIDFYQDQLHHHQQYYDRYQQPTLGFSISSSLIPSVSAELYPAKSMLLEPTLSASHSSPNIPNDMLVLGSDDELYDQTRSKHKEDPRRNAATSARPSYNSYQRMNITNGNNSNGNKRSFRNSMIRINTTSLHKPGHFDNSDNWSSSPMLSPFVGDDSNSKFHPQSLESSNSIMAMNRFSFTNRQRRASGLPQNVELSLSARNHARRILRQLMNEIDLTQGSKEEWEEVIMNLLLKVTNHVRPDIRAGDDMDVRHYVKIKKVPGGLPSDSTYVKGVMCTKNVAHKRMVKNITNPRILILMFSLDYSRIEMENQLLSIAPVISQEREHVRKLIGRIVALKPSLLIVKSTVSRLALEFLLEANIPVIHNVKRSVIEAIARCTQASIVTSVDKLQHDLSFGRCGSFEIKTIMHEWIANRRKTFLVFDNCAPELGGTIVLRGEKMENLHAIKRLIDFMVFVVNNLKLETSLLLDSFAKSRGSLETEAESKSLPSIPTDHKKQAITGSTDSVPMSPLDEEGEHSTNSLYLDGLLKLYQNTILSVSQFVTFPPPYLLLVLKDTEDKLALIQNQKRRKSVSGSSVITNSTTINLKEAILTASPTKSTFEKQSLETYRFQQMNDDALMDTEFELMTKNHQTSRAWDAFIGENPESISPFYHQNIVVLYSSVCTVTTVPCQGPEIRIFGFYRYPSDKTLGQYIMDLCNDAQQSCSSFMCDHPMIQHYRSYAHGNARVNVMIEKFPCPLPGMSDKLLMWSYCRECNKPTPVLPMSDNTWNYSFGKFLEVFFYQTGVQCRADICPHDITRNHVRYFGYMDLTVRFQYDSINLLEVAVPPAKLFIHSQIQRDMKEAELKSLRQKINKFYQSVIDRNKAFPFDLVDPHKLEACKAELQDMSLEAQGEKKEALQLVQNVYATSDPHDTLTINVVHRSLFQVVSHWEAIYTDFVQYYLQPERELKKITANQLRKMFPTDITDSSSLKNTDNERTKRATETTDLPLIGIDLNDDDDILIDHNLKNQALNNVASKINQDYAMMPLLSTSPSECLPVLFDKKEQQELERKGTTNLQMSLADKSSNSKKSCLSPEIRRRLSLDLLHELNEKFKTTGDGNQPTGIISLNRMTSNKYLRVKSPGTLSAAYTPSQIPIIRQQDNSSSTMESSPGRQRSYTNAALALPEEGLQGKGMKNNRLLKKHHRHHSIGHGQEAYLQNMFKTQFGYEQEEESHNSFLRRSSTTKGDRCFRSRLPRKKTYIQVYTQANDLVIEDIDDEFSGGGEDAISIASRQERTSSKTRKCDGFLGSSISRRNTFASGLSRFHQYDSNVNQDEGDINILYDSDDNIEPIAPNLNEEIDYFTSLAPFANEVVEPERPSMKFNERRRKGLSTHSSSPSMTLSKSPVSFERSWLSFSDCPMDFSSGVSGEEEGDSCNLPKATDLLKIQAPSNNENLGFSDLQNIHPDIILNRVASVATKGGKSIAENLEEIRHSAEKSSFMKTLTNLLTDSGLGNLLPLEYPLQPTEHLFPDSYVVVKEDEPSTIIAYTLSSEDYLDKMHDIQDADTETGSHDGIMKPENASLLDAKAPSEVTTLDYGGSLHHTHMNDDIQETLRRESGSHMRYNFSTGSTKFFCKIFFSEQFDALRRNCGCDESYIMSLASCIKWDSSGGKSGSAFLKTKDDRLLMKQLSKYELDAFLRFAPAYFQYMSEAFFSELPTVLAKIFGFYSIGYKNSTTGKSMRMDVLIMENLFYQRNIKKIFDLKGSMRNRHVQSTGKQDEVLLDENLVELIYQSPLFIRAHSKEILRSSLHNDTLFLSNRNVMDYSLLVGIDEEKQELVVGIVDFIRTFTWDKKLESWVKESGILGGGGKEPTIVSPRQYRIRFREAMERYFLMVPDYWALSRQSKTSYSVLHYVTDRGESDEDM